MGLESILILTIVFIGAFISASVGYGGGAFLIAGLASTKLPIQHVIPLSAVFALGFVMSRLWLFRSDVDWSALKPFWLGSVIGTTIGAHVYSTLSPAMVSLAVGLSILVMVWLPPLKIKYTMPHPLFSIGIVHSVISTMFGFGSIAQGYLTRLPYNRLQLTATIAGLMFGLLILKILSYISVGFSYIPYMGVIGAGLIASFIASWLGRQVITRINEQYYRIVLKSLMTIVALRLIYSALMN